MTAHNDAELTEAETDAFAAMVGADPGDTAWELTAGQVRALLSRLDAEKVTRETLAEFMRTWMWDNHGTQWGKNTLMDFATAILSIIPAQETRADSPSAEALLNNMMRYAEWFMADEVSKDSFKQAINFTRNSLKASPPQEPDDHMLSGIAEVYQVVGVLADRAGVSSDPQVIKVMDWLADPKGELDVLPFGLPEQEPQAQSSKDLHDDVLATISKYCWRTPENNLVIEDAAGLAHEVISMCSSQEPQGWLPIESAPKDGTPIQVARYMGEPWRWVRGWATWADLGDIGGGWISRGYFEPPGELGLGNPTHWKPLGPDPA